MSDPEVRAALARNGMEAAQPGTPAAFTEYLEEEQRKWVRVVQQAGIKLN